MTCFKNTKRRSWSCYIDAPGYGPIVEMTPRWLDDTTLQVALSDHGRYYAFHTHTTLARLVGVRRAVPELADALRWSAERRLGTRVVCTKGTMNDQLAAILRGVNGNYGRYSPAEALLAPDYPLASHQLKFKSWQRAFEFRMAWY